MKVLVSFTQEYLDNPSYRFMKGIDRNVKVVGQLDVASGTLFVSGASMMAWWKVTDLDRILMRHFVSVQWYFEQGDYVVVKTYES